MSTPALRRRIATRLEWQQRVSDPAIEPRNRLPTLAPLRAWQARRLEASFADFLAVPRTRPAAAFFRSDLYGDRDFSGRDRDVARIMPLMSRLLPESLLATAADAIELAVLSHAFDLRMAEALAARPRPSAAITLAAGLSGLQGFLERGFTAFAELDGADDFLDAIVAREREASRRLFAGDPDPFPGFR